MMDLPASHGDRYFPTYGSSLSPVNEAVWIPKYMYIDTYKYVTYISIYTYIHISLCIHIYIYICMYHSISISTCISCIHTRTYIDINISTSLRVYLNVNEKLNQPRHFKWLHSLNLPTLPNKSQRSQPSRLAPCEERPCALQLSPLRVN